jgi:hypothetical protein
VKLSGSRNIPNGIFKGLILEVERTGAC